MGAASAALAVAGLLLVDGALISIGAAGWLLVGIGAVSAWRNLRRLEVVVEAPAVAQAGDEVRVAVRVANRRRLTDAFRVRVRLAGTGGFEVAGWLPWIAAGSDAAGELRVVLPGRGVGSQLEVVLGSDFPWGFFQSERRMRIEHAMRVLPRPMVPVELLAGSGAIGSGDQRRPGSRDSTGELRGLRDYRSGDRMRTVAWAPSLKSAAHGGGLLVRELDPPGFRPRRVVLLFHSYGTDRALIRPDRFERALSLAWGAVWQLRSRRVPVTWLADFEEWVPREIIGRASLGALGDALARADRSATTEAHEVAARLDEIDGAVVMVSDMPPVAWRGLIEARPVVRVVDVTAYERGRRLKGGAFA